MTKAPAPMIGGMSWPPVDAEASTPAANFAGKPAFFISGMVMTPVETVLATAEPDTVPVSAEPITATRPGPPTNRPATARARSMTKSPAGARPHKECAEQNEHEHESRRDPGDGSEHARDLEIAAEQRGLEGQPGKLEDAADEGAPPDDVGESDHDQHRNKPACGSSCKLERQNDGNDGEHPVRPDVVHPTVVKGVNHEHDVNGARESRYRDDDVEGEDETPAAL